MTDDQEPRFSDFRRPANEPIFNLPKAVSNVLIALLAVQLVVTFAPGALFSQLLTMFSVIPGRYSALLAGELSPLGTLYAATGLIGYQFLHSGWMHFLMNSAWLAVFGTAVAYRFGNSAYARRRFYIFAAICGVAGALTHIVLHPTDYVPLVGASAAVAGLMAAALRIMFVNPVARWQGFRQLADVGDTRVLIFAGVYIGLNLMTGIFGFGEGLAGGNIAWQAHLGGFFTGLFLIGPFSRR